MAKNNSAEVMEDIQDLVDRIESKICDLPIRSGQRRKLMQLIADFPEECEDAMQLSATDW